MLFQKFVISFFSIVLFFVAGVSQAADQVRDQTRDQTKDQIKDQTKDQTQDRTRLRDQIYGSQLMTEQERIEHRNTMRSMKTAQEREAYQLEHHKRMQERAKEKGVTLPNEPMMRPGGMGPGGMGGGGMGPGGGRN